MKVSRHHRLRSIRTNQLFNSHSDFTLSSNLGKRLWAVSTAQLSKVACMLPSPIFRLFLLAYNQQLVQ